MSRCLCPACTDNPSASYTPRHLHECDGQDWRRRYQEIERTQGQEAARAWWRNTRAKIAAARGEAGLAELENLIRSLI